MIGPQAPAALALASRAATAFQTRDLGKHYRSRWALSQCTLDVPSPSAC